MRTLRDPAGRNPARTGHRPAGTAQSYPCLRRRYYGIAAPNAKLALNPLFRFHAGRRKESSQIVVHRRSARLERLFILTSTEDKSNRYHGNTLWFLSDGRSRRLVLFRYKRRN